MINLLNDIKEIVKSDKEHRIAIMIDSVYIDIKLIYDPERTFEESCFFIPIRYSSLEGYSYIDNSQYKENYKNTDIGINLEEINHKYCRELGNKVIEKTSEYIKQNISTQYVYVRYMGPKFVIAFSGVELNGVAEFINELKEKLENTIISLNETNDEEEESKKMEVCPKLNFTLSTYYKGTGLEEVLKKQEEYLDNCDANESNITNI